MKQKNETLRFLTYFHTYCINKHKNRTTKIFTVSGLDNDICLCDQCSDLAEKTLKNRDNCTKSPKPPCRKCPDNCHGDEARERVRKIMMYSGLKHLLRK